MKIEKQILKDGWLLLLITAIIFFFAWIMSR